MNKTPSYTRRLLDRYNKINEVLKSDITSVWGVMCEEMVDRFSDSELKKFSSGQSSKLNSIESTLLEVFGEVITPLKGINQRIEDNDDSRPFYVVNVEYVDQVREIIKSHPCLIK